MDFRKTKLGTVLKIMAGGMFVALLFNVWLGWGLGYGYPYNSFLLTPFITFSDYTDGMVEAWMPNPYIDSQNFYLPFTYVASRIPALLPPEVSLLAYIYIALAGLTLLLIMTLEEIVENPWRRVGVSLLLVALSYPIIFCIDRGNYEIVLALCVAAALYSYSRARYLTGTLWLMPAICCKIFPVLFLIFLARQRKWVLLAGVIVASIVITFSSAHFFEAPANVVWSLYSRNMAFFYQNMVYENNFLCESSSPWNMYKCLLIMAENAGLISPVNFDADGALITTSQTIFLLGTVLCAIGLALYACFIERDFHRCAALALILLPLSVPTGGDYRLLYICVALAFLVQMKSRRPGDLSVVVLLAFVLVPKKIIFLPFLGCSIVVAYPTVPDISIQVFLNPIFMMTAMAVLVRDGCRAYDRTWTAMRIQHFFGSLPLVGKRGPLPLDWLPAQKIRE